MSVLGSVETEHLILAHRTLAITRITPEDEAIYQCIAENSAGTNQASARLAISQGPELPEAPTGLRATALSHSGLLLTWDQPEEWVSQQVIGYVLHIRRLGGKGLLGGGSEPDEAGWVQLGVQGSQCLRTHLETEPIISDWLEAGWCLLLSHLCSAFRGVLRAGWRRAAGGR